MNMKNFEIPVLTENSRYLKTAALKFLGKKATIIVSTIKWLLDL